MQEPEENETPVHEEHGLLDKVSGFGQRVIGEIETIGGALTGDPNTAAEGEFNLEVGKIREELEDEHVGSEGDTPE